MRFGLYAIYQGIEYKASFINSDLFILRSHNIDDLSKGFTLSDGKVYIKKVHRCELDEIYKVNPKAIYQGYT